MASLQRMVRPGIVAVLILPVLLLLITSASSTIASASNGKQVASSASAPITVTVGAQKDSESQLLSTMYILLLRHAGLNAVAYKGTFSTSAAAFSAISNGSVDLYPEFTGTGLQKLHLRSVGDAQRDYLQLQQGYEANYHLTWLMPITYNSKAYNAASLIRDSVLKKAPQIATVLSTLASKLTPPMNLQLQSQVIQGKSVNVVAAQFLQSVKML